MVFGTINGGPGFILSTYRYDWCRSTTVGVVFKRYSFANIAIFVIKVVPNLFVRSNTSAQSVKLGWCPSKNAVTRIINYW